MRKLSKPTKEILESDPRMKVCALKYYIPHTCSQKIDWHHNLIYAGRQSNLPNTILGICSDIHREADKKEVREILDWIMLNQMTDADFEQVSRAYLKIKRGRLNKKYGTPKI